MTNYDKSKLYIEYNENVLNHNIVTGKLVYQACERMKSWFGRSDIYFNYEDVEQKIRFMQKLKHTKSPHTGQPFILEPYQAWIVANIVGWHFVDSDERVITTALLMLSRKAGKTFFAAALMLAIMITDKQVGAEGYMIANSQKQSSIAFEHASNQCRTIDKKGKIFSRYRSQIRIPVTQSYIQILSSDTSTLDGLSPSIFIVDEYAEAKSAETYNILRTGAGVRKNALGIVISTAGFNIGSDYPLYSMWTNAKNVLSGIKTEDQLFAAIYQLDPEDDWKDESVWIKSNPTLGKTVSLKYLREQVEMATNNPVNEVSVKTKNFNMFVQSSSVWIPHDDIKSHQQHIDLQDYKDEDVFMGLDCSMENDFSAFCVVIPPNEDRDLNPDKFLIKPFIYIPDKALEDSPNRIMYKRWINSGFAFRTPGNVIDTLSILRDQLKISTYMNIVDIAYDQYYALDWQIHAEEEGLHVTKHNQSLGAFTPSTNFFETEFYKGTIILDDNPIFLWMFDNVEMMYNEKNKTKKPSKSDTHNKIDGIIAMLEAITAFNADRGHQFVGTVWAITDNK